jgi:hypothetical protein
MLCHDAREACEQVIKHLTAPPVDAELAAEIEKMPHLRRLR